MDWDLLLRFQDGRRAASTACRGSSAPFRVHTSSKTTTVINSTGVEEMARLRRRSHGRDVSLPEIQQGIRALPRNATSCATACTRSASSVTEPSDNAR